MDTNLSLELNKIARQYFNTALSHVDDSAELSEKLRKSIQSLPFNEEAEVPGYEDKKVKFGKFENREFVVMMTDIRDSTSIINSQNGLIKMFLIFYVYAGVVARIVDKFGGTSTEFLGDGVLNLFDTKEQSRDIALGNSMLAAWTIMDAKDSILNPLFVENDLPTIDFGIGIDHGMTIVTRFGYKTDNDLKAFGRCAYNASKLCKQKNQIVVSDNSKSVWPIGANGNLGFNNPINVEGKLAFPTYKIRL
jgi:class 3 adenylate cyclase